MPGLFARVRRISSGPSTPKRVLVLSRLMSGSWTTKGRLAIVGREHTMAGIPESLNNGGELAGVVVVAMMHQQ